MKYLASAICCPAVMQSTGDLHHKINNLISRVAEHVLDTPE
jgi:hypothetical protein